MPDRARQSRANLLLSSFIGWVYLIPGAVLLAAVALIPAADDLTEAQWRRDQAQVVLDRRLQRLDNYATYLESLERRDRAVVLSLAATQLNLAPADVLPMATPDDVNHFNASTLATLEPPPAVMPTLDLPDSALRRLVTDSRWRPLAITAGALCLLVGLLPPARAKQTM